MPQAQKEHSLATVELKSAQGKGAGGKPPSARTLGKMEGKEEQHRSLL